jgi:hypothetical protein
MGIGRLRLGSDDPQVRGTTAKGRCRLRSKGGQPGIPVAAAPRDYSRDTRGHEAMAVTVLREHEMRVVAPAPRRITNRARRA